MRPKRPNTLKRVVRTPTFRKRVHRNKKTDYNRADKSWKNY